MLALTFWKISPKGRTFTFIGVPSIVVALAVVGAVMAIIIGVAVIIVMEVIMVMAAVMALGKGSKENPEKSSPQRKERLSSGLLTQNGTRMGVISTLIDISPA